MKTYKIGNTADCTISALSVGPMGNIDIEYVGQPYTKINDLEVEVSFSDETPISTQGVQNILGTHTNYVEHLVLKNVPLNEKIIALLFEDSAQKACTTSIVATANNEGVVFLPKMNAYNIYIYDINNELVKKQESGARVEELEANTKYYIIYQFDGVVSKQLNTKATPYMSLNIESFGNIDDQTTKSWLSFSKCMLVSSIDLSYQLYGNSIDLTFKILKDSVNYIVLE